MAIYTIFQAKEGILSQSADTLKKELLEVLKKKEQVLSKQVTLSVTKAKHLHVDVCFYHRLIDIPF